MPWLDDLKRLRVRVDNEGYGKQLAEVIERRRLLERYAAGIAMDRMMSEMNDILLDGAAELIMVRSWEYDFDDEDVDRSNDEPGDEVVYTLFWYDGEPVDMVARVGIDDEDAGYVFIDNREVDDDAESIQEALLESFRDIADMD